MNKVPTSFSPNAHNVGKAGIPARITACYRNKFTYICEKGSGLAHVKATAYHYDNETYPTTGDLVMLNHRTDGESTIMETLPRRTCFRRLDPHASGHAAQVVAANFDDVFIVQSLNQNFNLSRLERYLSLAWESGAIPRVMLTKADLCDDPEARVQEVRALYGDIDVIALSVRTGYGMERLAPLLIAGKTIVFLGSSGVGKSSLINAIAGTQIMPTGDIREGDGKGRHTTTHRQLLTLPNGVFVIDTPGMRELGIWDASEGIDQSFADVEQFLGQCRFPDCRHQTEPGCAIKLALQSGDLSVERWQRYMRLKAESARSDGKGEVLRRKQQSKRISKHIRAMKKGGSIRR